MYRPRYVILGLPHPRFYRLKVMGLWSPLIFQLPAKAICTYFRCVPTAFKTLWDDLPRSLNLTR